MIALVRVLPWLVGLAALAAIVAAIHHAGFVAGVQTEHAAVVAIDAARTAAEQAAVAKRLQQNAAAQDKFDKTNLEDAIRHDEADHAITVENDRLRADIRRAGGLRIAAPACPGGARLASAAQAGADGGPDPAAAATLALPEQVEVDLLRLAADADAVMEQARALQRRVNEDAGVLVP